MTLPTGNLLKAARALAGLTAAQLATKAGVDPTTISRMEGSRHKSVGGLAGSVDAVLKALKAQGVEIDSDNIALRLVKKPRR
jgi:transcriptional regulator with XRE-family HTH domain